MFKKSQAAMEFLMTYGWAILVVLVAIGALAYFGVLSPDKFLPNRCTLPAGIACIDHRALGGVAGAATIEVVLRNSLGYDLTGVAVSIGDCGSAAAIATTGGDCIDDQTTLKNGGRCTYKATCVGALTSGSKLNQGFGIKYTITETGLEHVSNGTITTRIE